MLAVDNILGERYAILINFDFTKLDNIKMTLITNAVFLAFTLQSF